MKIGLFFGTFNPFHIGHLVIGSYMSEFTDLDQVWFVVSPQNPLKIRHTLLPDVQRLMMVRMSIEYNLKLKASNIEFSLPIPSYTINTLTYIQEQHPDDKFVLIAGTDILDTFDKWKNYEQILEQYEIYVYPRKNSSGGKFITHPHVKLIEAPLMEISSTFIRDAIKNKKDVRYMLTEKVWEYVKEMHFYK